MVAEKRIKGYNRDSDAYLGLLQWMDCFYFLGYGAYQLNRIGLFYAICFFNEHLPRRIMLVKA